MKEHAAADSVQIVSLSRSSKPFDFGKAHIRVLAPAPDYQPGDAPNNNDSLVLEVSYGKHTVLLTGDAERPVEDELVASGELRPVTLLKVGHHGSKSSSSEEFLNQINPQFAPFRTAIRISSIILTRPCCHVSRLMVHVCCERTRRVR